MAIAPREVQTIEIGNLKGKTTSNLGGGIFPLWKVVWDKRWWTIDV